MSQSGSDLASLTLDPIGHVRTALGSKVEAARQPRAAEGIRGTIELLPGRNFEHALEDLDGWEYIWVVFWFHLNRGWRPKVLPPRSVSGRKGVFSTRSPHRPNPIGLSVVRLERVDGAASRWTVTPDSPLAKELLVSALRTGDDFRIGIALHSYADTWAHQHFSGRIEQGNVVDPNSPLPPAGHLQALRSPDDAAGRWKDARLLPELSRVDNATRYRSAARKIYRYLRTHLRMGFGEEELVLDELCAVWARYPGDMKARIASFTVDLNVPAYDKRSYLLNAGISAERGSERPEDSLTAGYDKLDWLRGEIARRSGAGSGLRRVSTGGRFRDSALRRWNDAARDHSELATALLKKEGLL